jgi:hypothetical protein
MSQLEQVKGGLEDQETAAPFVPELPTRSEKFRLAGGFRFKQINGFPIVHSRKDIGLSCALDVPFFFSWRVSRGRSRGYRHCWRLLFEPFSGEYLRLAYLARCKIRMRQCLRENVSAGRRGVRRR